MLGGKTSSGNVGSGYLPDIGELAHFVKQCSLPEKSQVSTYMHSNQMHLDHLTRIFTRLQGSSNAQMFYLELQ